MKKTVTNLVIKQNKLLSPDFLLLELSGKINFSAFLPGQFANLEIPNNKNVYLRRPFSIHDTSKNSVSFLIKIIGKGTETLATLPLGTPISVVLPLGNGFNVQKKGKAVLVGGGCGVAPLLLLAKHLAKNKVETTIVLGGKKKTDIVRLAEFKKYGTVKITTEDGSVGHKGFVTEALKKIKLNEYTMMYTCGPEAMLRGLYRVAKENNLKLQVSLESMMACGFGVCLCCVTPTKEGHLCVCKDGPVFDSDKLNW